MRLIKAFLLLLCAFVTAHAATAPIAINIIGKGTVRGATNGQALTIDKAYTLSAAAGAGFVFRGWSGSTNTTKGSVSFKMQPEFALTATFEDMTRPTVAIFKPKPNQRIFTSDFLMGGSAKDNDRVQQVQVRVNGGTWTNAAGTTFWEQQVALTPGLNKLEAVSTDYANRNSTTSSVTVTYVVCEPVQFGIDGPGKVTPPIASCYEIGKTYTVTAVPTAGCVFDGWSGSTNTSSRVLKFEMRSGLAFTAKFHDATKPTITVTSPAKSAETPNGEFTIAGRAADNVAVAKVYWSANGGQFNEANGTTSWNMTIPLEPGPNHIRVYSQDTSGNVSVTRDISIMSVRELARVYFPLHVGDQRAYLGPVGRTTKQILDRGDGSFNRKDGGTRVSETYYKYNDDFSQLLDLGGVYDTTLITSIPPVIELDQKYLAHGGSWTVQTWALAQDPSFPNGETGLEMKLSFKITVLSQVTVPAGVFKDCRRFDVVAWGYIPGKGWQKLSTESDVFAPNVGAIQVGLYRTVSTGVFAFGGWQSLEWATIDGATIGSAPGGEALSQPAQPIVTSVTTAPDQAVVVPEPEPHVIELRVERTPDIPEFEIVPTVRPQTVAIEVVGKLEQGFLFQFNTQIGRSYRVQASYDLIHWVDLLAGFVAQEEQYDFTDPVTSDAYRFYRVMEE